MSRRLVTSATTEAAWARALYEAWRRYGETPIYREVAAELGDPLAVEVRCA